jgi:hypothetical protein
MSVSKKSKMKFLLILPIIAGIIFFVTSMTESDIFNDANNKERLLQQFALNYKAMMTECSKDNLNSKELKSCFDAFDEVREFCAVESAEQCGDKQMEQLEQKLSDV